VLRLLALALVLLSAGAHAQPAPRLVALAPLATLDAEDTSAPIKKLTTQLEAAIGTIGMKVIPAATVADAIKKAKKPQLRACEGDPGCIAELGKLVGANVVVAGQIGGLGESKIVYLNATDVGSAKELRSTTLTLGKQEDPTLATAAIVRLLDPARHRGTLHFAIDVSNPTVYVNGARVKLDGKNELSLEVGTQAVRITHPEYRDFVRFIDVSYGKTVEVPVGMQQYPIVRRDIQGNPVNRDKQVVIDPPFYRRWYVVGGGAVILGVVTAIIVSSVVNDLPNTPCRIVGTDKDC
jgi:hypothetical protein